MRIIITRPEPECSRWVSVLQEQGLNAVALPLIDINPQTFELARGVRYDACVFVSPSAVQGFFKAQTLTSLQGALCLVTGPGTRAALIQCGVQEAFILSPSADAEQFDSEALWHFIGTRNWQGKRILIVRGANSLGEAEGRNWLAEQLGEAGVQVDFVVSYQRQLPSLSDAGRGILQEPQVGDVWVFSSSQAIQHLKLLLPSRDWSQAGVNGCAIATHERIFMATKGAGFARVAVVRPVLADIAQGLKNANTSADQLSWN